MSLADKVLSKLQTMSADELRDIQKLADAENTAESRFLSLMIDIQLERIG